MRKQQFDVTIDEVQDLINATGWELDRKWTKHRAAWEVDTLALHLRNAKVTLARAARKQLRKGRS